MMARASIRLPRRPRTERGEQKRATDAYSPATLARSLAAMGSEASRNTSMTTEHTRHTIQALAKDAAFHGGLPVIFGRGRVAAEQAALLGRSFAFLQPRHRLFHISMRHQGQAQAVARHEHLREVALAKALLVHFHARVRLHHRRAQEIVDVHGLVLLPDFAQRAFATGAICLPNGHGIEVFSHGSSPFGSGAASSPGAWFCASRDTLGSCDRSSMPKWRKKASVVP
mgnify:CR=1 FL=1